ncbi:MAG: sugar ABC transporter permease, partial [Clostridia bacterium]|nr:sugar ABC transporter permease [Clostridia bacterium]
MTSKQKRKLTEFLFLVPTLLAFLMVIIIPFIYGIFYSFTDWQGTGTFSKMVGFDNYKVIFNEPAFLHSFLVTLKFTVINIVTVNVVAFLISLLVTSEIRGRNVYRAGFFVPNLIGGIVLGLIWQFIFSSILPSVGQAIGWDLISKSLISNKDTVMFTMVTVNTWQYAGYIMLIYVAAIQSISKSVMEAAEVDGARYWTRITKIQIPLMANAFTISLFLTLTNSFKMYDVNVALTNGGPVGI